MPKWSEERRFKYSRMLHARRIFKRDTLFAVNIIRERYPGYTEEMLLDDIRRRSPVKPQIKGRKPAFDFRTRQIEKLVMELRFTDRNSKEYNSLCHRLTLMVNAHKAKQQIKLTCKVEGKAMIYLFHWSTAEKDIKQFAAMANQKGITHEQLDQFKKELLKDKGYGK